MSLRVRLIAADFVRQHQLATVLAEAGHEVVADFPDVVLCDCGMTAAPPSESEAPVLALSDQPLSSPPAGLLPRDIGPKQLDAALRAVASGLLVRAARPPGTSMGFAAAPTDESPLTPRETEILTLIGQGMSNKAVARRLGISVHTVKFHIEALFGKLEATSRAEAVAKGLVGGVIEL
jgi:two-component system nitrate/nitrite response regulator NarL